MIPPPMMPRMLLFLIFLLTFQTFASATNFFISPSGNDANVGTSSGAPWKTFARAISAGTPKLQAGDTLFLLDGTYTSSNSGYPNINCTNGANNGTSSAPITIQAQNERQAWLKGDGSAQAFHMVGCSYWNIIGLHASSVDSPVSGGSCMAISSEEGVFDFNGSTHLIVRRNIGDHNNRCANSDIFAFVYGSRQNLIEENEAYYYARHAFGDIQNGSNGGALGSGSEYRRNYANTRSYPFLSGGYTFGPTSYVIYASGGTYVENNISENNQGDTFDTRCAYVDSTNPGCPHNRFLGNISYHDQGAYKAASGELANTAADMPTDYVYVNNVAIAPTAIAYYFRACKSCTIQNSTMIGGTPGAYLADDDGGGLGAGDGIYQLTFQNSIAMNGGREGFGFYPGAGETWTWSFDHDDSYNNAGGAFVPSSAPQITNALTSNPGLGSCYIWIPDGSPMKGAGAGGADIGATILYQYVAGQLTTNKLWDPTTGAPLFKGATVTGLNDVAGSSLFDVANRLNINKNGCAFPSGYTLNSAAPNPPTSLTATAN